MSQFITTKSKKKKEKKKVSSEINSQRDSISGGDRWTKLAEIELLFAASE